MKHIYHHSDGRVIDLTEITMPFGLLDKETQGALKAHGGPYEVFSRRSDGVFMWRPSVKITDTHALTFRVKPAPVEETHTGKAYCVNNGDIASIYCSYVTGATHGTYTITTRDGKPIRAVWEADQ